MKAPRLTDLSRNGGLKVLLFSNQNVWSIGECEYSAFFPPNSSFFSLLQCYFSFQSSFLLILLLHSGLKLPSASFCIQFQSELLSLSHIPLLALFSVLSFIILCCILITYIAPKLQVSVVNSVQSFLAIFLSSFTLLTFSLSLLWRPFLLLTSHYKVILHLFDVLAR